MFEELGSHLEVTDVRPDHNSLGLLFRGELRPLQRQAVAAITPHERGLLVVPPGAGKTVMACAAIAHHDVPVLVLVDRKPLVEQWRERLAELLGRGLGATEIGQVGGGKHKTTGSIDVAMIQSVARATNTLGSSSSSTA